MTDAHMDPEVSPVTETVSEPNDDPLELASLDPDALFKALGAVESAVPELLGCLKPILAHLKSPDDESAEEAESSGMAARDNVERYLSTLDKIQNVLRQTVYYLWQTRASPRTLVPPPINALPTPLASTLPNSSQNGIGMGTAVPEAAEASLPPDQVTEQDGSGREHRLPNQNPATVEDDRDEPQLGLYASRLESKVLSDMLALVERYKLNHGEAEKGGVNGVNGRLHDGDEDLNAETMSVDSQPP